MSSRRKSDRRTRYNRTPCANRCGNMAGGGRAKCWRCRAEEAPPRTCATIGCGRPVLPTCAGRFCNPCKNKSAGLGRGRGAPRVKYKRSCATCEGLSWRRARPVCRGCGKCYAPEQIEVSYELARRDEPLVKF